MSAMQPGTLKLVSAESLSRAPALLGVEPFMGSMHARHVALVVSVNQALHVVDVDVDAAQAVTNAETWVGVHAPMCWTGVTKAATSTLATLVAGVGHTGPVPPLLLPELPPELEPEELPELEPDDPPELEPEELPEPDPELPPLLEPEPPPLPPPLPDPEPPPLPDPEPLPPPLLEDALAQAWLAARTHPLVSTQDVQENVCLPTW